MTSPEAGWAGMRTALEACRAGTLALFEDMDEGEFSSQAHPAFSPAGWHLGHIAYTEGLWLLAKTGHRPIPRPEYGALFDVNARKNKAKRCALPPVADVDGYLKEVRGAVLDRLAEVDFERDERLWHFILQHEAQHSETVAFLRCLARGRAPAIDEGVPAATAEGMVCVPGGPVDIGSDAADAMDNESPRHRRDVPDFRISRYPVTQGQFREFVEAGGYRERRWWSNEGWAWREAEGIERPLYWQDECDMHPVAGVSAHEADAWCRFYGVRLPTEFEWEKAAVWDPESGEGRSYPWGETPPGREFCNHDRLPGGTTPIGLYPANRSPCGAFDMLGNVWEWTSSAFAPYEGFTVYPYEGYSAAYFDGRHRVLRGGSWATRPWVMRASVRNWYTPVTRQILAGFRYAADGRGI